MRRVLLETWKPEQTSSNFQLTASPASCPVGDPGHLSRHSTLPLLGYGGQTSFSVLTASPGAKAFASMLGTAIDVGSQTCEGGRNVYTILQHRHG